MSINIKSIGQIIKNIILTPETIMNSELLTIKGLIKTFINDPLLYISYIAMSVYYLIFSHNHILTFAYCCTIYRHLRIGYMNGFDIITIIMLLYSIYRIYIHLIGE